VKAAALACVLLPLAACLQARAAPNEIKIFTDEIASPGEHTLEVHANRAPTSGYQVMPEYSYGVHPGWELSLQLPVSAERGRLHGDGYRAEMQYVAPHDPSQGAYFGFNAELGREERRGDPQHWNLELIPILAWRGGEWHFVANPGVNLPLSGPDRKLAFNPAAKAAYQASAGNAFGLEYFRQRDEQSQLLFFVWDGKLAGADINLGLGRGLTGESDRWVLKTIIEFPF
jgi:hypothetical protein